MLSRPLNPRLRLQSNRPQRLNQSRISLPKMAPSRKPLFERRESDHPLTPLKLKLLLILAECQILTIPQLAGMTSMSRKAVQLHMRDLFDLGLVARVGIPRSALADLESPNDPSLLWGRAPTIYHLSKDGAKELIDHRYITKEALG